MWARGWVMEPTRTPCCAVWTAARAQGCALCVWRAMKIFIRFYMCMYSYEYPNRCHVRSCTTKLRIVKSNVSVRAHLYAQFR